MSHQRVKIVRAKLFEREYHDEDNDRFAAPLTRCITWVKADEQAQQVFVILSHQRTEHARAYEAIDEIQLRRWATTPNNERLAHEIIWTSTKLYIDIDAEWNLNPDVEQQTEILIKNVIDEAMRRFNVTCDTVILDASVPNIKFSRHIIITMRSNDDDDDGQQRNFATAQHCGAFVIGVERRTGFDAILKKREKNNTLRNVPLCDHGVYGRRQSLRIYGSDKLNAQRPLTVLGKKHSNVLDYDILVRSLVTLPRITDENAFLRVSDDEMEIGNARSMSRKRMHSSLTSLSQSSSGRSSMSSSSQRSSPFLFAPSSDIMCLIESIDVIVQAGVRTIRSNEDGSMVVVDCRSRYCERLRRDHKSHTAYYVVNTRRKTYSRRCHDPECHPITSRWVSFGESENGGDGEERPASAPPAYGSAMLTLFSDFAVVNRGQSLTKSSCGL